MANTRMCSQCGAKLAPHQVGCSSCARSAAASVTASYPPAARAPARESPPSTPFVDVDHFRQAALELQLLDAGELDVCLAEAGGDVMSLARLLVRAGRLTQYQAGVLAQGKGKGLAIGPYLVLKKRGQGGMGVVFKARHRSSGREVALKILLPSFGRDREAVARFRREFEVAARLDHPNVVRAIESDEDRGVQYLTMEYVEGTDLDELVQRGGPLDVALVVHCAIQAARGLAAAHAVGIVHRDVKPGNLILDQAGQIRVLDLGLARVIEATSTLGRDGIAGITQTGAYMGTVDYIAPEQADDSKRAEHRADVYALGCTIFYLLTGRPPFSGGTILQRLMAHQQLPAPSLLAARDDVPRALEAIYQAMMAKTPGDRPRSMEEVIIRLESCRSSAGVADDARESLRSFAATALKRAAPKRRGWDVDASVFARRPQSDGLQFDPDLRLEDLVADYREDRPLAPLAEEKLPPALPRLAAPRRKPGRRLRPRRLAGTACILAASIGVWVAWTRLVPSVRPAATPTAGDLRRAAAPPPADHDDVDEGFVPLFRPNDLEGWKSFGGGPELWSIEGGVLATKPHDGAAAFIATGRDYSDFVLEMEFLPSGVTNGGVMLCQFPPDGGEPACVELVDLGTGGTGNTFLWGDGGPFRSVNVPSVRYRPDGEWNSLRVERRSGLISSWVNGERIHDGFSEARGRYSVGFQNYPKEGVIRHRNVRIKDMDSAAAQPPGKGDTDATGKRNGTLVLYSDDFDSRNESWSSSGDDPDRTADHAWGYRDGVYFNESRHAGSVYLGGALPGGPYTDFSAEIVARVTGNSPSSTGAFAVHLDNGRRGFQVRIDGTGALHLEPSPTTKDDGVQGPWFSPVTHASIRPGGAAYNTLRLDVRKRRLDVFVDGVRVCPPLLFDWDLTPAQVSPGVDCQTPNVRAEFDRIEIKALGTPDETAGASDPTGTVRFLAQGERLQPDGVIAVEGATMKWRAEPGVSGPYWQNDMAAQFGGVWTNDRQLFWNGPKPKDVLTLDLPVDRQGLYQIIGGFTVAPDYGRFKLALDGQPLYGDQVLDLSDPQVQPSKPVLLGTLPLTPGVRLLSVTVVGKARGAAGYKFGLDEIRLVPAR